jgi:hypothetical protein
MQNQEGANIVSRIQAVRLLVALALFACPTIAAAETPSVGRAPLGFRLDSANPAMRSDAPFAVNCILHSSFTDVVNGELDFEFVDDNEVCVRLHGDPIVVPNGESSFRLVLPPMHARRNLAAFSVRVTFQSTKGTLNLGTHDLLVPLKGRRQFLIACPSLGKGPVARLAGQLRLDEFRPAQTDLRRADLVTVPVDVELRDMPAQSIGLYPYDLLLLAEEGFSRLSARQLEAVAEWIDQGGRVVVVPSGVLTPAHKLFLEHITSHEPDAPVFVLDSFGHLQGGLTGSKRGWLTCRCGFGRALILPAMPQFNEDGTFRDIKQRDWTRAVCFVWNVRNDQTATILKTGTWRPLEDPKHGDDTSPLRPLEFARAAGLRQMLFPGEVRIMPFSVVVLILTLFLLAVAPGDYFLHGWLRRRWVSWMAFPLGCLLFTVGTVWIAGGYTGRADHRTELVIVDLGVDGKPRRTSRIEHVLTAETRPLSSEVHSGIFAVTDIQPAAPRRPKNPSYASGRSVPMVDDDDELDRFKPLQALDYAGTLPSQFTVSRLSPQWSPSMHRVTRPGADVTIPNVTWSDLDALDLEAATGRQTLLESLRGALPGCEVLLESASRRFVSRSEESELRESTPEGWAGVMSALAQRTDSGLFSIVSHVAPNGAGNLEDLAVADPARPDEWLLQFATRQGDELIVYRRMMRPKSSLQTEHER